MERRLPCTQRSRITRNDSVDYEDASRVDMGTSKRTCNKPEVVGESMTLQEQVKALPEAERLKFFRQIMEVVDAGRKAGVPPEEWAKMYADTYKHIEEIK